MLTRRRFLASIPPALLALTMSRRVSGAGDAEIAAAPVPERPRVGYSTRLRRLAETAPVAVAAASPRACRVLQFTDLHFLQKTKAEDARTLDDLRRHIDRQRPDLVVVSGDVWHDNRDGRGAEGAELAVTAFGAWGVPWAMTWGNHDQLDAYQPAHDAFEAAPYSAYRGGGAHGDYRIEVRAPGGGPPVLDVFCLNSSREGIAGLQTAHLQELAGQVEVRGRAPASLAFFHIPTLEFESRLTAATFRGLKMEPIGRWPEIPGFFSTLATRANLRASFCGHCHCNDYVVRAGGHDLVFGRASGYGGYGHETVPKGAKLIEVDLRDGTYRASTVFADGRQAFV